MPGTAWATTLPHYSLWRIHSGTLTRPGRERDARAMDRPVWCAWCVDPIEEQPTRLHGVPFHWRCLRLRMAAIRMGPPSPVRGARLRSVR